jgi:flavorubredoxin/NADPH-dependent 2,4-dienoyl-CoA reductase/sulfur reductase-like enzyme
MNTAKIKNGIHWIGALDPNLRVFDIIMYTPYGTTYNSYIVQGSEKTAIFETVKEKFFDEFINRLSSLNVDVKNIDYIILNHTEPDHAGSVSKLLELSPKAKLVGSSAALRFMKSITNKTFDSIIVNDGDTLNLGDKKLKFISAPFLHWPDSIYTYIVEDKILITCDSFGSHYCNENIFNDLNEDENKYMEALKYYFNAIMGPFKPYVLKAIDKIKNLEIDVICPGHGPVLRDNPSKIVKLYKEWSTHAEKSIDEKCIVIPYVSAYGYTETLANKIAEGIKSIGDFKIDMYDVIHHDINEIIESIEKAQGVLFGSPTINGDALKPIMDILVSLNPIVHGNKIAAAFGSYGWSGEAVGNIENRMKELRMDILSPGLRINFKPSESELISAYNFGQSFAEKINENLNKLNKKAKVSVAKQWKCVICGLIMEGTEPPDLCPACGAGADQFIEVTNNTVDFKNDKNEEFVIIGNGAAGFYAADSIRKRNTKCNITMISSENSLTYYRPQLSDYLTTSIPDSEFYIASIKWYKDNNVKVLLNTPVENIDSGKKIVFLNNGSKISYDKLILANGSSNFMPKITGNDKKGVFTLKYLSDAKNIKNYMNKSKNAVIIGGGLLGLEAAWEMKKAGLNVTVVEFSDRLLSRQLDIDGSELFKKAVDLSGINIITSDSLEEIIGDDTVKSVRLKSNKILDADIVLFSVGIRPNKSLGEKTGLQTNKGIIVNDKMETSIKDIYSCGDVSEFSEKIYGNWPAAIEMGTTAGANAAGDECYFTDFVSSTIFSAANIELFSCGSFTASDKNLGFQNPEKNIYQKLFFRDNKLIGGILIGDTKKAGKIIAAIQNVKTIQDIIKENFLL